MKCAHCEHQIYVNDHYYRAGRNGTIYCSTDCAYRAYEGFYAQQEIDKTMERHKRFK
mgnify:CR=1 FL=1